MPVPASRNGNRSAFPVLPYRLSRRVSLSLQCNSHRRILQPCSRGILCPSYRNPSWKPPSLDSDDVWTFWTGVVNQKGCLLHDRNLGLKQRRAFLQSSHSVDRWLLGLLSFCGIRYLRYATFVHFLFLLGRQSTAGIRIGITVCRSILWNADCVSDRSGSSSNKRVESSSCTSSSGSHLLVTNPSCVRPPLPRLMHCAPAPCFC